MKVLGGPHDGEEWHPLGVGMVRGAGDERYVVWLVCNEWVWAHRPETLANHAPKYVSRVDWPVPYCDWCGKTEENHA